MINIQTKPNRQKKRFVFFLLNEFTLLSFAGAVDALRSANRQFEAPVYEWLLCGEGGESVTSSAGLSFRLDMDMVDLRRDDTLLVCAGLNVLENTSKKLLGWLRREARRGVTIGAMCTGPFVLARAGLLDGKRATIHWENHDSFSEEFTQIELTKSVFVAEGKRLTTAGGTSSIDLMLKLIADDHGEDIANIVANQLIYSSPPSAQKSPQSPRLSAPSRINVRHPKLSAVIQMMEANIEEPIPPSILARDVGLSTRQLERLFRRYLSRSPKRYYMELRLGKARNLLMQTSMSVINVALACGFASPSHFSKCYRAHYSTTPYRERGTQAAHLSL